MLINKKLNPIVTELKSEHVSPKQMNQRLSISLAQTKTGNTLELTK